MVQLGICFSDALHHAGASGLGLYQVMRILQRTLRGVMSLGLSILTLAVFSALAQVSPLPLSKRGSIDIDGNGKSVLLVRTTTGNGSNTSPPQMQVGRLVGNGASSQFQFTNQADPGASFRIVGVTDYDGNGRSDLLVQNMTQGEFGDVQLLTDFLPSASRVLRQVKQVWDVQAVGDLDGDGKGDLVWRYVVPNSPDTGVSYIWFSNGNNLPIVRKRGGAPLNWKLLGAADLNADNAADMVYISPDNQIRVLMATPNRTCANMTVGFIPQGFTALALADFTGRNRGDVLIRNNATGQVSLMALNASGIPLPVFTGDPDDRNASCTPSALVIPNQAINLPATDPAWQFYAAGDYDGNGTFDIVWLKPDGTLALWLMGKDGAIQNNIPNAGSTAMSYASTNGTTYWSPMGGSNGVTNPPPPPPPPPPTNQAPTVSITTPVAGTSVMVNTVINIAANAADSDGTIAKVEFFANGVKLGEDTAPPYVWAWTPTIAGAYTITARATDNKGAASNSAALNVTITTAVIPPAPTNQAPTVSLTAPGNNTRVTAGTAVNIAANAVDSDGTVTKVEFFASVNETNTKLGEDTTSPFTFTWTPTAAGAYTITAKATDDKGVTTTSAAVSVAVTAAALPPAPTNQAPTVSLTAPGNNTRVTAGTAVNIAANAVDSDGTVTKVEFFASVNETNTKLGEDTTSPFTFTWTPTAAGAYTITAKATDDKGVTTTSAAVSVAVTAAALPPAPTNDWYVSGTGSDRTGLGTPDSPYRSIQKAADQTNPGDTVWIKNGSYSYSRITRSGNADSDAGRIKYKAFPGHTPELTISGTGNWYGLQISASYITIEGLILTGNSGNITLEQARADRAQATPSSLYNVNDSGIASIESRSGGGNYTHHVTIRNNIIRRFGCAGIVLLGDYMVVENNKIYENGWYTRYGCSGISYMTTRNFDSTPGYRNRFTDNIMWNNKGLIEYTDGQGLTDGNGFIFDVDETDVKTASFTATGSVDKSGSTPVYLLTVTAVTGKINVEDVLKGSGMPLARDNQPRGADYASIIRQLSGPAGGAGVYIISRESTSTNAAIESWSETGGYTGRTLIANNLAVNNGGSGIHVFKSRNADVVHNTVYKNATVMNPTTTPATPTTPAKDYPDLFAAYANDVKLFNNIVFASTGHKFNSGNRNTNVFYDYNMYFDGTLSLRFAKDSGNADIKGTHDIIADPQFVNPSLSPCVENLGGLTLRCDADFSLRSTSPALNEATYFLGAPITDIRGVTRPRTKISLGAYQFAD
jgi:parallel beta-helix repeat protein